MLVPGWEHRTDRAYIDSQLRTRHARHWPDDIPFFPEDFFAEVSREMEGRYE